MLSFEKDFSLIDFHELLRFGGPTDGKEVGSKELEGIIAGWNAWRLLCSDHRDKVTEDWIRQNLVKNRGIAKKLWDSYVTISISGLHMQANP